MNDLIDFADVGTIPEPTIWTKPPLDLDAIEAKITGLTPQWPLPGPAEKAMRELIEEVRKLRADDLLRQAVEALRGTYKALDLMPYTAMQTGLAGTKEWDRIYGERNAFGACDKARAVLSLADERGL